jgi:hypothetical protein
MTRPRAAAFVVLLAVVVAGAGCSAPRTASGTLDEGKQRVTALVLAAAHALPGTVTFHPPTKVGTQPCRKTVAGYTYGRTGAHRAEVPLIVAVPDGSQLRFLGLIANAWTKAGYRVDRSRIDESGFPQLSADTPAGDHVAATAFVPPRSPAQIDLYAVSPCLRGS